MPPTENSPRRGSSRALAPIRPLLRAIACAIVPEAAAMTQNEWAEFDALVDAAIMDRPPALQRRLLFFLHAMDWLPLFRFGHRFVSLQSAQRARFLSSLENHPVQIIRSGFWGLRTLVLLGYYGRPKTAAAIGYAADPRGWEARR